MGLIPGFGQIADIRDLSAAIRDVVKGRKGAWLNVAVAVIAFVPGLDFLKGGRRAGQKLLHQASDAKVTKSAEKYNVGRYSEIKGTVPGLDAHHVGQKALMKDMIPGYDPLTAPSILVPKVGHTIKGPNGIVSRSAKGLITPRDVVARDIRELRRVYPDIPNSKLQQLIQMNKDDYPDFFNR